MSAGTMGSFYGVGVGPGDPELITRKAARILFEVDWIFFPSDSKSGGSFGRRIVEPLGLPAEKFCGVFLEMSRNRFSERQGYRFVADQIAREVRKGKSVAWITEGDPLFYSTFLFLYEEMRRRFPAIRTEIIPGVTSASAAAARAGVPVCRLDERIAVVPAAYGLENLPSLFNGFTTVFLLKIHTVFDQLLSHLASMPECIQAVYVEKAGTPEERVVWDLETLRGQKLSYFSLVVLRKEKGAATVAENEEEWWTGKGTFL